MASLSVITATTRPGGVDILTKCLANQTFTDFEWVIVTNRMDIWSKDATLPAQTILLSDPPKRPGDFYRLNGAWNEAFRNAKGELFISIVDLTWIAPDTLERFWNHYQANPKAIISGIGHQYDQVVNNKPEHLIWRDPRARTDQSTFYEVGHLEVEWCVTSIPRQAVYDVGGIEEEFDKCAVISEKEMNYRMTKAGYTCYLDQTIEYRAVYHPRLAKDEIWDKKYNECQNLYNSYVPLIASGERLKLNYVK